MCTDLIKKTGLYYSVQPVHPCCVPIHNMLPIVEKQRLLDEEERLKQELMEDIKKLLSCNLELVKTVLVDNVNRVDSCNSESLIKELRKDNEMLRKNILDINIGEWSRNRQFNSLTKRLRYYFDKAHELRELLTSSRNNLLTIEEMLGKLGILRNKTTVDTIRNIAQFYIDKGGLDACQDSSMSNSSHKRKAEHTPDNEEEQEDAGHTDKKTREMHT